MYIFLLHLFHIYFISSPTATCPQTWFYYPLSVTPKRSIFMLHCSPAIRLHRRRLMVCFAKEPCATFACFKSIAALSMLIVNQLGRYSSRTHLVTVVGEVDQSSSSDLCNYGDHSFFSCFRRTSIA